MTSLQVQQASTEDLDTYREDQIEELRTRSEGIVPDAQKEHSGRILDALETDLETLRSQRNDFYVAVRNNFVRALTPEQLKATEDIFKNEIANYISKDADGKYQGSLANTIRKYMERYETDVLSKVTDEAKRNELRAAMQNYFNELQAKEMLLMEKHLLGLQDTNRLVAAEWLAKRQEFDTKYRTIINDSNINRLLSRINPNQPALEGFMMTPKVPNSGTVEVGDPDASDDYEKIYQIDDRRSLIKTHVTQSKGENEGKPYHFERSGKTYRMTVAAGESTANKLEVAKRMIRQARVDHPRQRFINLTNLIPGIFDPNKKDDKKALEELYIHAAQYGFSEIKAGIEITEEVKSRGHEAQVKFAKTNSTAEPTREQQAIKNQFTNIDLALNHIPSSTSDDTPPPPPPPPARDLPELMRRVDEAITTAETGFGSTQREEVQRAAGVANTVATQATAQLPSLVTAETSAEDPERANTTISTLRTLANGLTQRVRLCELNEELIAANNQAQAALDNLDSTDEEKHTAADVAENKAADCEHRLEELDPGLHEKNNLFKTSLDEKITALKTKETALRARTIPTPLTTLHEIQTRADQALDEISTALSEESEQNVDTLNTQRQRTLAVIAATERDLAGCFPEGPEAPGITDKAKETRTNILSAVESLNAQVRSCGEKIQAIRAQHIRDIAEPVASALTAAEGKKDVSDLTELSEAVNAANQAITNATNALTELARRETETQAVRNQIAALTERKNQLQQRERLFTLFETGDSALDEAIDKQNNNTLNSDAYHAAAVAANTAANNINTEITALGSIHADNQDIRDHLTALATDINGLANELTAKATVQEALENVNAAIREAQEMLSNEDATFEELIEEVEKAKQHIDTARQLITNSTPAARTKQIAETIDQLEKLRKDLLNEAIDKLNTDIDSAAMDIAALKREEDNAEAIHESQETNNKIQPQIQQLTTLQEQEPTLGLNDQLEEIRVNFKALQEQVNGFVEEQENKSSPKELPTLLAELTELSHDETKNEDHIQNVRNIAQQVIALIEEQLQRAKTTLCGNSVEQMKAEARALENIREDADKIFAVLEEHYAAVLKTEKDSLSDQIRALDELSQLLNTAATLIEEINKLKNPDESVASSSQSHQESEEANQEIERRKTTILERAVDVLTTEEKEELRLNIERLTTESQNPSDTPLKRKTARIIVSPQMSEHALDSETSHLEQELAEGFEALTKLQETITETHTSAQVSHIEETSDPENSSGNTASSSQPHDESAEQKETEIFVAPTIGVSAKETPVSASSAKVEGSTTMTTPAQPPRAKQDATFNRHQDKLQDHRQTILDVFDLLKNKANIQQVAWANKRQEIALRLNGLNSTSRRKSIHVNKQQEDSDNTAEELKNILNDIREFFDEIPTTLRFKSAPTNAMNSAASKEASKFRAGGLRSLFSSNSRNSEAASSKSKPSEIEMKELASDSGSPGQEELKTLGALDKEMKLKNWVKALMSDTSISPKEKKHINELEALLMEISPDNTEKETKTPTFQGQSHKR